MLSIRQDALLLSLRPSEALNLLPRAEDQGTWRAIDPSIADKIIARAAQAQGMSLPATRASDYKRYLADGSPAWLNACVVARERLKALCLGACVQGGSRFLEDAADALYALCEMSDWSLQQDHPDFPDFTHGVIDLAACETGALVATVLYMLEDSLNVLSPRIASLARHELDERLMEPLINQTPQSWLLSPADMPRAAAALMTLALMIERDDRRRWLALRWILRILDGAVKGFAQDGGFARGLEEHLEDITALGNCFALLSAASGGEVELRDEQLFVDMAESFLKCHIGDGWFVNPGGDTLRPHLSPDLLYQLGEGARVDALCGFASYLRRIGPNETVPVLTTRTPPLLNEVMSALNRADLLKHAMRAPRAHAVEFPLSKLLTGQMDDFYASLSGPSGGLSPAGDITLFYRGSPVLVTLPAARPVPAVNGYVQLAGKGAQDAEAQSGPGWQMLSMNLTAAYPPEAGLTSWQRTWMLAPFEGGVRLMDVFDLDRPGKVSFRLALTDMPKLAGEEALLAGGRVIMRFDPSLVPLVERVSIPNALRCAWGDCVWQLSLVTPDPIPGGNYAFFFTPAHKEE